jgi:hypothetical protein
MTSETNESVHAWGQPHTMKERTAVQRSVTALLDELAPERALKRAEHVKAAIEQHRTPTGCVLQASNAAVTVSWFTPGPSETGLGELHVIGWRGVVTRRGGYAPPKGATVVAEMVFRPREPVGETCHWVKADDDTAEPMDAAAIAARCVALLDELIANQG